jgi:hypothetical protein
MIETATRNRQHKQQRLIEQVGTRIRMCLTTYVPLKEIDDIAVAVLKGLGLIERDAGSRKAGKYWDQSEWKVARLTELMLMGHSWKSVRNIMNLSKPEFDRLLDAAVSKAQNEQMQVEAEYGERRKRIEGED